MGNPDGWQGEAPVEIVMTRFESQRVRDLLFTLRDLDQGENVADSEIEELAAMFPGMAELG